MCSNFWSSCAKISANHEAWFSAPSPLTMEKCYYNSIEDIPISSLSAIINQPLLVIQVLHHWKSHNLIIYSLQTFNVSFFPWVFAHSFPHWKGVIFVGASGILDKNTFSYELYWTLLRPLSIRLWISKIIPHVLRWPILRTQAFDVLGYTIGLFKTLMISSRVNVANSLCIELSGFHEV